jgi:hypothetical protein
MKMRRRGINHLRLFSSKRLTRERFSEIGFSQSHNYIRSEVLKRWTSTDNPIADLAEEATLPMKEAGRNSDKRKTE